MQQLKREGSIKGERGLYKKLKIPTLNPKSPRSGVTFHFYISQDFGLAYCHRNIEGMAWLPSQKQNKTFASFYNPVGHDYQA